MQPKLIKCELKELSQLVAISRTTFIEAFEKDNNPDDFNKYIDQAFSKDELSKQLNNPNSFFYFLMLNGELAAYIKLNILEAQTDLKTDDTMELERIYVVREHQGKQLGAFLLKEIVSIAAEHKKAKIWLGVWDANTAAIRFYEKHGFTKFGTHPYFIGKDKQTDWLMQLKLPNFSVHSKTNT